MRSDDALDQFWQNEAHIMRAFLDIQPNYDKLAEEVAYILEKRLRSAGIEYSSVTRRTKSAHSFCEKAKRRGLRDPLKEITDIAGVRVVFLYKSDRKAIETVIQESFEVVKKVDKTDPNEPDRFGYQALHFLIRLRKEASCARYDDLRELGCEIQVRTILQDAWAIVAHHLSYKDEASVPKEIMKNLNALSGVFVTADNQFNAVRSELEAYRKKLRKQISERKQDFLGQRIDLDNLIEYLYWRFPNRGPTTREAGEALLLELRELGYGKLEDIELAVSRSLKAIEAIEKHHPPINKFTWEATVYSPVGMVRLAIKLTNEDNSRASDVPESWSLRIEEYRHLVIPKP
ncbi:MAG: hypothetical protein JW941_09560 [Candidatus Coatesbacteria bacterium]|nr:hypothetical protein [Candidatus Coatesbacteria bacterium]